MGEFGRWDTQAAASLSLDGIDALGRSVAELEECIRDLTVADLRRWLTEAVQIAIEAQEEAADEAASVLFDLLHRAVRSGLIVEHDLAVLTVELLLDGTGGFESSEAGTAALMEAWWLVVYSGWSRTPAAGWVWSRVLFEVVEERMRRSGASLDDLVHQLGALGQAASVVHPESEERDVMIRWVLDRSLRVVGRIEALAADAPETSSMWLGSALQVCDRAVWVAGPTALLPLLEQIERTAVLCTGPAFESMDPERFRGDPSYLLELVRSGPARGEA